MRDLSSLNMLAKSDNNTQNTHYTHKESNTTERGLNRGCNVKKKKKKSLIQILLLHLHVTDLVDLRGVDGNSTDDPKLSVHPVQTQRWVVDEKVVRVDHVCV